MRMHSRGSLVAVAAAAMLLAAGIALARSHGDHGHHGHHGWPGGPRGGGHGSPGGPSGGGLCDSATGALLDEAVAAACPCDGPDDGVGGTTPWRNHGQYVRCVAHATRDLLRSMGLKRRCAKRMVPCAAASTCGKNNSVACVVASTGSCLSGACTNDPETSCVTDADCTSSSCRVTSAERCAEFGGTAGSGSCCTASPSGAFIDPIS